MNLGTVFHALGRLEDAGRQYEQAIALSPEAPNTRMNLALIQLCRGDFSSGWRNHEWRWQLDTFASPKRNFAQPQWHGEPLLAAIDTTSLLGLRDRALIALMGYTFARVGAPPE
jgi:hypothetical protein